MVKDQVSNKHRLMAESPVQFLRGTFYRWTQLFPEICPDLNRVPNVLAVGDLHIASFGTWRDGFGRLIWGVDDFDEAHLLPYTNDLIRLAASSVLDALEGEINVGLQNVLDVILEGYTSGLKEGGRPFVLEEEHKWLRKIALERLDIPAVFWRKMDRLPTSRHPIPAEARKALAPLLPAPQISYRVVRRTAGVGSLGHSRYVAVADWQGGQIALEAKEAIPSACAWARPRGRSRIHYQVVLERAIRCPDPYVRLNGKWLVRQLAPDSSPIEIESMSCHKNQDKLLHAMAWETANVHLGTKGAVERIIEDLKKRPCRQLKQSVKAMIKSTVHDSREWRRAHPP